MGHIITTGLWRVKRLRNKVHRELRVSAGVFSFLLIINTWLRFILQKLTVGQQVRHSTLVMVPYGPSLCSQQSVPARQFSRRTRSHAWHFLYFLNIYKTRSNFMRILNLPKQCRNIRTAFAIIWLSSDEILEDHCSQLGNVTAKDSGYRRDRRGVTSNLASISIR
jgi:hypothetical protein